MTFFMTNCTLQDNPQKQTKKMLNDIQIVYKVSSFLFKQSSSAVMTRQTYTVVLFIRGHSRSSVLFWGTL